MCICFKEPNFQTTGGLTEAPEDNLSQAHNTGGMVWFCKHYIEHVYIEIGICQSVLLLSLDVSIIRVTKSYGFKDQFNHPCYLYVVTCWIQFVESYCDFCPYS